MKSLYKWFSFILLISYITASCQLDEDAPTSSTRQIIQKDGSGDSLHIDFDGSAGILEYTYDIGDVSKDVYLIFTNTGFSNTSSAPTLTVEQVVDSSGDSSSDVIAPLKNLESAASAELDDLDILVPGKASVSEFNRNHPIFSYQPEPSDSRQSASLISKPVKSTVSNVGDARIFYHESNTDTISSTLKAKIDLSPDVILQVWVENDSFSDSNDCDHKPCMSTTMVNQFAEKFLSSDSSTDDIYDWVTDIIGQPWGPHSYPGNLIAPTTPLVIDILFFEIPKILDSTVLGFYWAKDSCINNRPACSNLDFSNESIMFYMNSTIAANPIGGGDSTWDITDPYPAEIVSTLAHEFQHMINFYQKDVTHQSSSGPETWINEMASMIVEDLLATKMQANGPRGFDYNDPSAGSAWINAGRLPKFNINNNYSVTKWYTEDEVIISYSMNYSFGAFLSRNFGGAQFLKKMVQNSYTDYRAITNALSSLGYSFSFSDLLKKWAFSVLLSDTTTADTYYKYNTGTSFDSSGDSYTFNLGSINLFNYSPTPKLYSTDLSSVNYLHLTSNLYVKVGNDLSGKIKIKTDMPSGVQLSIISKD